jgi:hypothetical protein
METSNVLMSEKAKIGVYNKDESKYVLCKPGVNQQHINN